MPNITKEFNKNSYNVQMEVHAPQNGWRLDQFIKNHYQTFSREFIKRKIRKKEISILQRDALSRPSTRVHEGQVVAMMTPNFERPEIWRGRPLGMLSPNIIHEDEDFLIAQKPPFMATHPTGKHIFNCLTIYLQELYSKIYSVHRLDRETSGLIIFARTLNAVRDFTQQFELAQVTKIYFCIAHVNTTQSFPVEANENLETRKDEDRMFVTAHSSQSHWGKSAYTEFHLIERCGNYAFLLAAPYTGRQHQIRVHAQAHGFPLLGDKLYHGGDQLFSRYKDFESTEEDYDLMEISRHALHAYALSFTYKNKTHQYFDQIPPDLKSWIIEKSTFSCEDLEEKMRHMAHSLIQRIGETKKHRGKTISDVDIPFQIVH